jgi:hypothetical protein
MMNQSLSSTEGLTKEKLQYSEPSLPGLENHVRYMSRHLFFQHERISTNERSRLVIHASIQLTKNQ